MQQETTAVVKRRGEYKISIFTVRYAPLRESPQITEGIWTRYTIYTPDNKLIRVQISVPCEADCWNGAIRELDAVSLQKLREEYRNLTGRRHLARRAA